MNCPTFQQATSGLSEYQAINTVLFIVLIALVFIAIFSVVRYTKRRPNDAKSRRSRFIELEKDYKWRRLKVVYLITSILILLIVIGASHGTDTQGICQTIYDFQVERAEARMGVAFWAIVMSLVLWAGYFLVLPAIYRFISGIKNYLSKTDVK